MKIIDIPRRTNAKAATLCIALAMLISGCATTPATIYSPVEVQTASGQTALVCPEGGSLMEDQESKDTESDSKEADPRMVCFREGTPGGSWAESFLLVLILMALGIGAEE